MAWLLSVTSCDTRACITIYIYGELCPGDPVFNTYLITKSYQPYHLLSKSPINSTCASGSAALTSSAAAASKTKDTGSSQTPASSITATGPYAPCRSTLADRTLHFSSTSAAIDTGPLQMGDTGPSMRCELHRNVSIRPSGMRVGQGISILCSMMEMKMSRGC